MLNPTARRWLAGLGVAGAFVASAGPAAAVALDPDVELHYYFDDTTIAAGSEGKVEYGTLYSSAPVELRNATVRYDFSDLAGKATVAGEEPGFGECEAPEANVLVCAVPYEIGIDEWGLAGLFPVKIAPSATARDGDTGKIKATFSATGFQPLTHMSTVRIGTGVDLAAEPEAEFSAAPGGAFTVPLTVSNIGETTGRGVSLLFYGDYGIRAAKRYSNCTYQGDELRTCQFDNALATGTSYRTSLPFNLAKETYAPGNQYAEAVWLTSAEFEDFTAYLDDRDISVGTPGTDGELTLTAESSRSRARAAQADTDPTNNATFVQVRTTGKNGADLAAIGDEVTGKVGDVVKATVGYRNNGPATLDGSRGGSSVTHMDVDIPTGTTAVSAPDFCWPRNGQGEAGQAGVRQYRCGGAPTLPAGDEVTGEFGLRIDKVVANASGAVKINVPCDCDGGFYDDLKPANDNTQILVNADGGSGGGGDGGGLPVTGDSTGVVVGAGILLLAAGAGGYLLARRRRTRFIA